VFASGGTRKPDLSQAFHERRTREFGGESEKPSFPRKIEFGIGGDAISCCLEGLYLHSAISS